jgi:hypothetical protein
MVEQQKQVPSIGRMVHYVAYGTPGGEYAAGAHRAAIIVEVPEVEAGANEGLAVKLAVFNPTGIHWNTAWFDETGTRPGTWHWPEYVPAK